MQPALPINIQTTKIATGKMPAVIGGKLGVVQMPGQTEAVQDFSNILSLLTGKGATPENKMAQLEIPEGKATKIVTSDGKIVQLEIPEGKIKLPMTSDVKLKQDVIKGLLEGSATTPELNPEQAAELKTNALLTSKKAAQFNLLENNTEALTTETPVENLKEQVLPKKLLSKIIENDGDKKLVPSIKSDKNLEKTLPLKSEDVNLEQILSTKNEKPVVTLNPKMVETNSRNETQNFTKKDFVKTSMPIQKGEVAFVDNNELLNLRQPIKSSKTFASKEYSKAHNPFESNVIQLKKEPKFEKEINKLEQETMKPLDLLARESSNVVQNIQREPQQMSVAIGGAHQTTKALDITNVNNSAEIVNKIVNYLEQNNIQNRDNIEVAVKHETLGQFNVNVQRASKSEDVSIQILTNSEAGHDFFVKNENLLNKALVDAGVKVADIRLGTLNTENMMSGKQNTDSNFNGNFSGQDQNGQRYYSEKQQSQDNDSRRRQELWEQYKERSLA